MSAQVVHHQRDLLRLRVVDVDEISDGVSPVSHRAPFAHSDVGATREGLQHHEDVGDPVADVFMVIPCRTPRRHRQGPLRFADQLLACLVQTNQRVLRVVRPLIDIQHVLHRADELGTGFARQAPHLPPPRLQLVFFNVLRTVSGLTLSTSSKATRRPASSFRVPVPPSPRDQTVQVSSLLCCQRDDVFLRGQCRSPLLTKGPQEKDTSPGLKTLVPMSRNPNWINH